MKAFEKNIRKVEPYVPGEQPQRKVIKLNTNENPYPPAPGVTKALEEMDTDPFPPLSGSDCSTTCKCACGLLSCESGPGICRCRIR